MSAPEPKHEMPHDPALPPAWSLDVDHQARHVRHFWQSAQRVPVMVRLIAIGKAMKGVLFLLAGLAIARLLHAPDLEALLQRWIAWVHADPTAAVIHRAIDAVSGISSRTLELMGFGAFTYATLYLIEALGLWFDRRWAEWLTVISTCLLIPTEISHLIHHPGAGIAAIFLVNVAVLIYLLRRVLRKQEAEAPPAR